MNKKFLVIYKKKVCQVKMMDLINEAIMVKFEDVDILLNNKDEYELLEYINRKDINGAELHDKAIVQVTYTNGVRVKGYIKYSKEKLRYLLVTKNSTNDLNLRYEFEKVGVLGIDEF